MRAFWDGVWAGAAALIVTGVARALLGTPFAPELLAERLFEWVPMELFAFFVRTFGVWSKWIAFVGTIALVLAASGGLGWALSAGAPGGRAALRWYLLTPALAVAGYVLLRFFAGAGPLGRGQELRQVFGVAFGAAAYAWAFLRLRRPGMSRSSRPGRTARAAGPPPG